MYLLSLNSKYSSNTWSLLLGWLSFKDREYLSFIQNILNCAVEILNLRWNLHGRMNVYKIHFVYSTSISRKMFYKIFVLRTKKKCFLIKIFPFFNGMRKQTVCFLPTQIFITTMNNNNNKIFSCLLRKNKVIMPIATATDAIKVLFF